MSRGNGAGEFATDVASVLLERNALIPSLFPGMIPIF